MVTKSTVTPKERRGLANKGRCLYPQRGTNLRKAVEGLKETHDAVQLFLRKTCCVSPDSNLPVGEPQ